MKTSRVNPQMSRNKVAQEKGREIKSICVYPQRTRNEVVQGPPRRKHKLLEETLWIFYRSIH